MKIYSERKLQVNISFPFPPAHCVHKTSAITTINEKASRILVAAVSTGIKLD